MIASAEMSISAAPISSVAMCCGDLVGQTRRVTLPRRLLRGWHAAMTGAGGALRGTYPDRLDDRSGDLDWPPHQRVPAAEASNRLSGPCSGTVAFGNPAEMLSISVFARYWFWAPFHRYGGGPL
jgi:hypothetical protein